MIDRSSQDRHVANLSGRTDVSLKIPPKISKISAKKWVNLTGNVQLLVDAKDTKLIL